MAECYLKRREESTGTAAEEDVLLNFVKKRKLCSELEYVYCGDVKSPENSVSSAASLTYGCSADDDDDDDESSDEAAKSAAVSPDPENIVDLRCEDLETEISTAIDCSKIHSTPTSEICGDSEQSSMESTPHAVSSRRNSASLTAEIEEFFAAAEKYEQKRFAEKYNYDIVKDVPLDGKYQWVPLHP